jgi:hypothetical protein
MGMLATITQRVGPLRRIDISGVGGKADSNSKHHSVAIDPKQTFDSLLEREENGCIPGELIGLLRVLHGTIKAAQKVEVLAQIVTRTNAE